MNPRCVRCSQSDAFLSGRPPHSAFEEVECVPNGMKTQAYESRTKCVLTLTPHARHNCVREDRISGTIWHANAKAEPHDHQQEVYPAASKIHMSLYSTHRLNSDTSRITLRSLNLPISIPPWHKNRVVIICRPCYGPKRAELAS